MISALTLLRLRRQHGNRELGPNSFRLFENAAMARQKLVHLYPDCYGAGMVETIKLVNGTLTL